MSGDQYKIRDQHNCYFLTITVVHWIDVFTRKMYKDIIVDSLNYCVEHKGLELYAWVIMSNHIHLVGRVNKPGRMSDFLRDFKKFTSKGIAECIQTIRESRREWLLDKFSFEARKTGRAENYKIWKDSNHALDLQNYNIDLLEKVNYTHENPVRAGLVSTPEHYNYSSAIDYANGKGLIKVVVV
jgi:putative transposase